MTRGPESPKGLSRVSTLKTKPSGIGLERMAISFWHWWRKYSWLEIFFLPPLVYPLPLNAKMMSISEEKLSSPAPSFPIPITMRRKISPFESCGKPKSLAICLSSHLRTASRHTHARVESSRQVSEKGLKPPMSLMAILSIRRFRKRRILFKNSSSDWALRSSASAISLIFSGERELPRRSSSRICLKRAGLLWIRVFTNGLRGMTVPRRCECSETLDAASGPKAEVTS